MLLIYDFGDDTYHQGDGEWTSDFDEAELYATEEEARAALDDVDCDELMRDRLKILSATEVRT